MGNQIDERLMLIGVDFMTVETTWTVGKVSLAIFMAEGILLPFSTGDTLESLEPHCSQKLFAAGFLVLQFAHTFVSAIPNSLVM